MLYSKFIYVITVREKDFQKKLSDSERGVTVGIFLDSNFHFD